MGSPRGAFSATRSGLPALLREYRVCALAQNRQKEIYFEDFFAPCEVCSTAPV